MKCSGGEAIVDALGRQGVEFVFCVPGESFLPTLDALCDPEAKIRVITCRHEGGAAFMAEAYGKLTGRPGVCLVTRAPGACNAMIALHTAFQDSTPLVMFVGDVERETKQREAFQEVEYRRMLTEVTKWVGHIDDSKRIPELVSRAFHVAMSGRPGPTALVIPEDMQFERNEIPSIRRYHVIKPSPSSRQIVDIEKLLAAAKRPIVMVGGGGWTSDAARQISEFAREWSLPVCGSHRCQDIVDNTKDTWIGALGTAPDRRLVERVKACDVLLVVGPRLGEITTQGYSLLDVPIPKQQLIHVHADPAELGRVFYPTLAVNSGMEEFAQAVATLPPPKRCEWTEWANACREDYVQSLKPTLCPGPIDLNVVLAALGKHLKPDAIVVTDSGNFTLWPQRYHQFRGYRSQLAQTSGAMGYGIPAAVAASLVSPERQCICWVGDGCFLMTGQEIATAIRYKAAPIVIVVNNRMYGTIRMHQECFFPDRVIGTDLTNPDFALYAQAFGGFGAVVKTTEEFEPALIRAIESKKIAVIELQIDPNSITPNATLEQLKGSRVVSYP